MTPDVDPRFQEAERIAAKYCWDTPSAVEELHQGRVPEGFGHEVGLTISLFKRDFPFGRPNPEEDDQVASELGRLRLLLAQLSCAAKSPDVRKESVIHGMFHHQAGESPVTWWLPDQTKE